MKPFSSLTLASSLLAALTFSAHAEESATVEKCPKNFGAVGGSYGTGDLSDIALNWIVDQARTSGVTMFAWGKNGTNEEWGRIANPVVHGKGADVLNSDFCLRANNEVWAADCTLRKNSKPGGLTTQQIADLGFVSYSSGLGTDADGSTPIIGTVNMEEYAKWLNSNYDLTIN